MALSSVVLPAPLGPMIPRMRPSSTRRSTPSSAIVVPKALRRPRASIDAMASALLLFGEQLFQREAKPLNGRADSGPFFAQESLAFRLEQELARAGIDEHAPAPLGLDEPLVHQLLVALQDREGVDPIFRRDIAHRGQRIAFLENVVQNHGDDTVP